MTDNKPDSTNLSTDVTPESTSEQKKDSNKKSRKSADTKDDPVPGHRIITRSIANTTGIRNSHKTPPLNQTPKNPTTKNQTPKNQTPKNPTPKNPTTKNPTTKNPTTKNKIAPVVVQSTSKPSNMPLVISKVPIKVGRGPVRPDSPVKKTPIQVFKVPAKYVDIGNGYGFLENQDDTENSDDGDIDCDDSVGECNEEDESSEHDDSDDSEYDSEYDGSEEEDDADDAEDVYSIFKEISRLVNGPENSDKSYLNKLTREKTMSGDELDMAEKLFIRNTNISTELSSSGSVSRELADLFGEKSPDHEMNEVPNNKTNVEQYLDMVKIRTSLLSQMNPATPDSDQNLLLERMVRICNKKISTIIQKSRVENATEFTRLTNQAVTVDKHADITYFTKNCSDAEQRQILNEYTKVQSFNAPAKPPHIMLLQLDIPVSHKAVVMQKIQELQTMSPDNSEYAKLKRWVDGFMRIPHGIYSPSPIHYVPGQTDVIDIREFMAKARATLDQCTYGMESSKLQMMTMLGTMITNPNATAGNVIAIQGPMGTGKTTLIKNGLSRILGREFEMIALGGAGHSSFLAGSDFVYEGSRWGQIVQSLMNTKSMNPIIFMDEVDKTSQTETGREIIDILIHLTDPAQNAEFRDKYFSEITIPLDRCIFIFSYNDESKINPILRDRFKVIRTSGYTTAEKVVIARDFLIPDICKQIGFQPSDIIMSDAILNEIITNTAYCEHGPDRKPEDGVRNLRRSIETIFTKLNLIRLSGGDLFKKEFDLGVTSIEFPFTITSQHLKILATRKESTTNQSYLAMYT